MEVISAARQDNQNGKRNAVVEDNRRMSNGDQVNRLAVTARKSVDFTRYWQRPVETLRL